MPAPTASVVRVTSLAQLGVGFAAVHTVGYQRQLTVSLIHIVNLTAGAVTVELCACGNGIAPSITNAILWNFSVPANDFLELGDGMILLDRGSIQGLASAAASINVMICGIEQ